MQPAEAQARQRGGTQAPGVCRGQDGTGDASPQSARLREAVLSTRPLGGSEPRCP